ncbi:methylated-DNA--[protein]-cysteine S-methyltransferase [Pseudopedobacter beijingensis]|uniref:Methylated-DNA--[protein]-cysteine S-methyltransferase n=1 Tax=Pseudopedobacter beijingensis TaxID=1207056 RepID=A0ABW4I6B1_9SPHI
MKEQDIINYNRIARAIDYIKENFKEQPSLDEIAEVSHLSPYHFQRLFTEWAGTTPKKFLQFISVEHAKRLLSDNNPTLFDVAHEIGLSGTSRLHDLFVSIEGMTPAEYKNGCRDLEIGYSFGNSVFGRILTASTHKGICYMAFADADEESSVLALKSRFPNARFVASQSDLQEQSLAIFKNDWSQLQQIKLHLKGTDFQLKVWETLLKIPMGKLVTYGHIADMIGSPKASRAVGSAIGKNPIAFLIPCHRVIQNTGLFGGYMWGNTRKTAIIGWESAQIDAI